MWAGTGRPPKLCDDHAPARTAQKRRQRQAEPAKPDNQRIVERRRERRDGQAQAAAGEDVSAARRLAIAMRLEPNARRAARLVGIVVPDAEFAEILAEASSDRLAGLRKGNQTATAATVGVALALGAERLLQHMPELPVSQLGVTLRALTQVLDSLGGGRLQYSSVELVLRGPANAPPLVVMPPAASDPLPS